MNQAVIHDPQARHWLQFTRPCIILQAGDLSEVMPLLTEMERLVRRDGLYAVGWIGYEASPAFDPALCALPATSFPLAYFGLFGPPTLLKALPAASDPSSSAVMWRPSINRDEYHTAIGRIRNHLAAGDTYQVNYTFRHWGMFSGDPWELFLRTCVDAPYGAFLDTDAFSLCSASPELFFSLQDERIFSKPMKGTAARGRTLAEDRNNAVCLHESEKNRAENVMIVDMIRNDLGRIALTGSVKVPRLYEIEKYPTVWQMTSTVEAMTTASFPDILRALFPCASVTGAPKVKTMEIITSVETAPRNIYTGAIGFLFPDRLARFSVAIRTILIDKFSSRAEYGVGGGIVWDSTAAEEYEECLNKSKIILDPSSSRPFRLLETLLWTSDEGYFLLSRHLERLRESAFYFDYPYDEANIRKVLDEKSEALPSGSYRIRLLLSRNGDIECSAMALSLPGNSPLHVRLARQAVHSGDPFLYHKTTRRDLYEKAQASFPDADDVILYNEAEEVTESCIANVVILRNGRLLTPPVRCGLLNGTYRAELLDRGEITEETVSLSELKGAEKIFLINSVRKWREAVLSPE